MNPMQKISIDKVVLNIGVGEPGEKVNKAVKLLEIVTGKKPIKTKAKVKQMKWGLRPGLEIGAKVTLRGKDAEEMLKRAFAAKDNKISARSISNGYFSIGIHEYIDIPGVNYNPDLGIFGMDVCVNLKKPGKRVELRKIKRSKLAEKQKITKEETIKYIKEKYNVEVE